MNYRNLGDADPADFAKNAAAQLTAHAVGSIEADKAAELANSITLITTPYETAIEASVQQSASKIAKVAAKAEMRNSILDRLAIVRNHIVAGEGSKKEYDACGFTFPRMPATVIAAAPTKLSAAGTSNGVNTLKFSGNNKNGAVVYEIRRLSGDTEPFRILAITKKQTYADTPVTPGQVYNYKVRAVAAAGRDRGTNNACRYI